MKHQNKFPIRRAIARERTKAGTARMLGIPKTIPSRVDGWMC